MKSIKFILKIIAILFFSLIPIAGVLFVLSTSPLIVSISFVVILGLIIGYFAVRIKLAIDKKNRESNIDEKIEKQKYEVKMTDIIEASEDEPEKSTIKSDKVKDKVKNPIEKPVKELKVPKPVDPEVEKIKDLERVIKDAQKSVKEAKKDAKKKAKKEKK